MLYRRYPAMQYKSMRIDAEIGIKRLVRSANEEFSDLYGISAIGIYLSRLLVEGIYGDSVY